MTIDNVRRKEKLKIYDKFPIYNILHIVVAKIYTNMKMKIVLV